MQELFWINVLVIMKINSQQLKALYEKNEVEMYSFSMIQNNYYIHLMNDSQNWTFLLFQWKGKPSLKSQTIVTI